MQGCYAKGRLDCYAACLHFSVIVGVAAATAVPEHNMNVLRPIAGRSWLLRGAVVALALLAPAAAMAAAEFPYDQTLMLNAARVGRVKRVPMLTVSPNGDAAIRLWCKDVSAHVELSGNAIKIEAAPLPEALPQYMSDGQCSPERMQADGDTLAVLTQMAQWRVSGDTLVLSGPKTLRFFLSSH
jgi:heat shock protein HslJ